MFIEFFEMELDFKVFSFWCFSERILIRQNPLLPKLWFDVIWSLMEVHEKFFLSILQSFVKSRAQLFNSLKADLRQDINKVSSFRRCHNGIFPWKNCSVKWNWKCSIKAPAKCKSSVYVFTEMCIQWVNNWAPKVSNNMDYLCM